MFGEKLPHVSPGSPISAKGWNALCDRAEKLSKVFFGSGLKGGTTAFGSYVAANLSNVIFATLTAVDGAGRFTWQEIAPTTGGGWENGPRSGSPTSDPAREINGNTTGFTFPTNVILERATGNGALYFEADLCSC